MYCAFPFKWRLQVYGKKHEDSWNILWVLRRALQASDDNPKKMTFYSARSSLYRLSTERYCLRFSDLECIPQIEEPAQAVDRGRVVYYILILCVCKLNYAVADPCHTNRLHSSQIPSDLGMQSSSKHRVNHE